MRLLICEDEEDILNGLAKGLRKLNYYVDTAMDGEEALSLYFESEYDLIILDLNMPKLDGLEVLKTIREDNAESKVIILSARDTLNDKVLGLDLGANDYLIKPFHFDELEARIRSLLRRKQVQEDSTISAFGLIFDTKTKTASVNDERIKLTVKETGILEYLLLNQGRYVLQEELLEHVWESDMNEFSNTVRVHVYGLRNKLKDALGKNIIRNEIGRGYIIDKE